MTVIPLQVRLPSLAQSQYFFLAAYSTTGKQGICLACLKKQRWNPLPAESYIQEQRTPNGINYNGIPNPNVPTNVTHESRHKSGCLFAQTSIPTGTMQMTLYSQFMGPDHLK